MGSDDESSFDEVNAATFLQKTSTNWSIPNISLNASNSQANNAADDSSKWSALAKLGNEVEFEKSDGHNLMLSTRTEGNCASSEYRKLEDDPDIKLPKAATAIFHTTHKPTKLEANNAEASAPACSLGIVTPKGSADNNLSENQITKVSSPVALSSQAASVSLTASQVMEAQKHCRFAASALEYDDVEQARKELTSAIAILDNV